MITLPSIFKPPTTTPAKPAQCCCGTPSGVSVIVNPANPGFAEGIGVQTRAAQADAIIRAARAKGIPTFQGV